MFMDVVPRTIRELSGTRGLQKDAGAYGPDGQAEGAEGKMPLTLTADESLAAAV